MTKGESMSVSDEAVEAAARAMPEYTPEDEADSFDLKANEVLRGKAEVMLTAAAPFIAAQALEEAASELAGKRLLTKPFHEYYPEWLNNHAKAYRSGKNRAVNSGHPDDDRPL